LAKIGGFQHVHRHFEEVGIEHFVRLCARCSLAKVIGVLFVSQAVGGYVVGSSAIVFPRLCAIARESVQGIQTSNQG
jgi:hypothetical protein